MALDTVWPVGPTGETRIRIVRPAAAQSTDVLPVILYTHGGGWVLGDTITHDRLVRELANGIGSTVIFVDYLNAPEAKYPTQQEQAYASLLYLVEHADELRVDPARLAIVGDSVGGHMAAQAYADELAQAGVRVTSVRYNETMHDFVMLNPLANTPATRAAIRQAIDALKAALAPAAVRE
jgi:acetyl esterase/lipase